MRILMFGRGVIATTYGLALEQAGHEVEFYVRPGRSTSYGPTIDIDLLDARRRLWGQRMTRRWPVRYRETLDSSERFDLIVLSVAHHRLAEAANFLATRIGDATVLVFGNVWAEPLAVVGDLAMRQVAWGFPTASGSFDADGVLHATLLPQVIFGTFGRPLTERERAVRQIFSEAGFRLSEQPDFRGWLWLHFVLNAGIHSQGLRAGSLSMLAGDRSLLREALLTARELLPLVKARGVDLRQHRSTVYLLRAPSWPTAQLFAWATRYFPPARRSMQAHTNSQAEEPRTICRDTLSMAKRLGIEVPRLEAAKPLFADANGERL